MELHRAATTMLIRTSSAYTPSLMPSTRPQAKHLISHLRPLRASYSKPPHFLASNNRTISTSTSTPQQNAAARKQEEEDDEISPAAPAAPSIPARADKPPSDPTTQPSDKPTPRIPITRGRNRYNPTSPLPGVKDHLSFLRNATNPQRQPTPPTSSSLPETQPSTMTDLINMLTSKAPTPSQTPPPRPLSNNRANQSLMLTPSHYTQEYAPLQPHTTADLSPPPFRMGPALGRTVPVNPARQVDVARAFAMVNIRCALNNVRGDAARQRFYERPGAKRKRLASQRWIRRFAQTFDQTCRRVQELRKKGW